MGSHVKKLYTVMQRGAIVTQASRGPVVNRIIKLINHTNVKMLSVYFILILVVISLVIVSILVASGNAYLYH